MMNFRTKLLKLVTKDTLAITPFFREGATHRPHCLIINKNKEIVELQVPPVKVMEELAQVFDESLNHLMLSYSKKILCNQKSPIALLMVQKLKHHIFFPTLSTENPQNYWISFDNYIRHRYIPSLNMTNIQFVDGSSILVPASQSIIQRQITYAASLSNLIRHKESKNIGILENPTPLRAVNARYIDLSAYEQSETSHEKSSPKPVSRSFILKKRKVNQTT